MHLTRFWHDLPILKDSKKRKSQREKNALQELHTTQAVCSLIQQIIINIFMGQADPLLRWDENVQDR